MLEFSTDHIVFGALQNIRIMKDCNTYNMQIQLSALPFVCEPTPTLSSQWFYTINYLI